MARFVIEGDAFKWQHLPLAMDAPPGLEAENPKATAALRAQSNVGFSLDDFAKSVNDSVAAISSDWQSMLSMLPYISTVERLPAERLVPPEKMASDPTQQIKATTLSLVPYVPPEECRQDTPMTPQPDSAQKPPGSPVRSVVSPVRMQVEDVAGKKQKKAKRSACCPWPLEPAQGTSCPWPLSGSQKIGSAQAPAATASKRTPAVAPSNGQMNSVNQIVPAKDPSPRSERTSQASPVSAGTSRTVEVSIVTRSKSPRPLTPGLVTDFLASTYQGDVDKKAIPPDSPATQQDSSKRRSSNKKPKAESCQSEPGFNTSCDTTLTTVSTLSTDSTLSAHSTCSSREPEVSPEPEEGLRRLLNVSSQAFQGSQRKQKKKKGAAIVSEYTFLPQPGLLEAFDFVPKLYGRKGANMKQIADSSGGKVRCRGRGSRYYEQDGYEAPMGLRLYLSCSSRESYEVGHKMVKDLLWRLEEELQKFCSRKKGLASAHKYGTSRWSDGESNLFVHEISRGESLAHPSTGAAISL